MVEVEGARIVAGREAGPPRRLHLRLLHEEGRAGEELVAAAVVEVEMRVHHVADVVRPEPEEPELGHDVLARLRLVHEPLRALGAHAADRVDAGLAVDAGVEEEPPARVHDQEAYHRYRPRLAGGGIVEHAGAVQLEIAAAEGKDRGHGGYDKPSRAGCQVAKGPLAWPRGIRSALRAFRAGGGGAGDPGAGGGGTGAGGGGGG